jgi:hypothetical protein
MPKTPPPARSEVQVRPNRVVRDPATLRWGTVSTIRAPLADIARFVAFHLDLGAAEVHIYLDRPDVKTAAFFAAHPAVKITQCTDEYWAGKPIKARNTHQLRQVFNASRCYRNSGLDWLAHIDVDEFILAPDGVATMLGDIPADAAFVRLRPAEMLAQPDPWSGPSHFKLTRQEIGVPRSVLYDIYPEFGPHIPEGFISYIGGKNIARTGMPNIRFGLHALLQNGARVTNGHIPTTAHIGHAHAPSWDVFRRHMNFRMEHGSYRRRPHEAMKLGDVLGIVHAEDGEPGLRRLFDELCQASPSLLSKLAAHQMLLTATLDLDEKVARWFGKPPASEDQT